MRNKELILTWMHDETHRHRLVRKYILLWTIKIWISLREQYITLHKILFYYERNINNHNEDHLTYLKMPYLYSHIWPPYLYSHISLGEIQFELAKQWVIETLKHLGNIKRTWTYVREIFNLHKPCELDHGVPMFSLHRKKGGDHLPRDLLRCLSGSSKVDY